MADNYLITGYWGEPHVTAENDRGIHAGIFGAGRFVLPVGEQFRAEYIGNNTVRVYDGKLMNNGAAAGIPAGEYVDLLIANASQGMKRNDLIVFQYSKDASTQIETGSFVLVKGAESSGTAGDPELTQADLLSGNASLDQMPLWRVVVSGTAIAAPVQVFTLADSIPGVKDSITKADVGLGNVDNVKQYSASNPPPYPVTSVDGKTGEVSTAINYSTEEVKTNDTWVDGKPIYTRTFVQTGVASGTSKELSISDIPFKSIWTDSMNTFCIQGNTVYCSHHTASTHARISTITIDLNAKILRMMSETGVVDFYVTVRYTKTTD